MDKQKKVVDFILYAEKCASVLEQNYQYDK